MTERILLGRKPECGCIEYAEVYDTNTPGAVVEAEKTRVDLKRRGLKVSTVTVAEYNREPIGCKHKTEEAYPDGMNCSGVISALRDHHVRDEELEGAVKSLKLSVENLTATIGAQQAQINLLDRNQDAAQDRMMTLEGAIKSLSAAIHELHEQVKEAHADHGTNAQELEDLRARVERLENRGLPYDVKVVPLKETGSPVRDGFGNEFPPCSRCGSTMQIVRPGQAVCPRCDHGV